MDKFNLKGKEYNFLFSLRAIHEYQERLMKAKEDDASSSVDEIFEWSRLGFKYGNGGKMPFDDSYMIEALDEDFETALQISAHCRTKLIRFNSALTGNQMAENVNGESKKKKVAV